MNRTLFICLDWWCHCDYDRHYHYHYHYHCFALSTRSVLILDWRPDQIKYCSTKMRIKFSSWMFINTKFCLRTFTMLSSRFLLLLDSTQFIYCCCCLFYVTVCLCVSTSLHWWRMLRLMLMLLSILLLLLLFSSISFKPFCKKNSSIFLSSSSSVDIHSRA